MIGPVSKSDGGPHAPHIGLRDVGALIGSRLSPLVVMGMLHAVGVVCDVGANLIHVELSHHLE